MDILNYNKYVGLNLPENSNIQVGKYENKGLLKSSHGILIDHYRISLKIGFKSDMFDQRKNHKAILFVTAPNILFDWDVKDQWSGNYIALSEDWLIKHNYLFRSIFRYTQQDILFVLDEDIEEIKNLFERLLVFERKKEWNTNLFLAYLNTLIELINNLYKKQFLIEKNNYNKIVSDFLEHVRSYSMSPKNQLPSVSLFAKKLNVSPNYLGDIIKHFTDKSAKDIIHTHIIDSSKKMLIETNLSISEISSYLGYEYPNYFSRFFKKKVGVSPVQYRNQ